MFTNLQSYLRANEGQSGRLAGDISQDIEKQAQSALQEYDTQAQDFEADIEAASITPEKVSSATSFASRLADVSTDVSGYLDPSDDTVTRITGLTRTTPMGQEMEVPNFLEEQEKERAAKIRQGFGDVSLDTEEGQGRFQTALGLGEQAERAAGETATAAGRRSLLDQQFGRPDYTTGEKSFDELLLSGDQEARGRFQGLRQSLAGEQALTTRIQQGRQELLDRLSQARSSSEALKSQYEQSLTQAREDLLGNLDTRASNLEQERIKAANQALLTAGLGGVDLNQAPELYGINLAEYLRDPRSGEVFNFAEDLSGTQVATAEDVGRLRALYELAGLDPNTIDPALTGDTFTQQTFGSPELQLDQFEKDVVSRAREVADQVVEASAAQIPPSDQLSYRRMADDRPLFDDVKYPGMVNQAMSGLESQLLDIAAQDRRLGTGAAAREIERTIQEGQNAVKQSRVLNLAMPGKLTDANDQMRMPEAMKEYGISEQEVNQAKARISRNPVLQDFSNQAEAMRQFPGNPEEFNEKFVQPLFNKYASALEARNNPRLTPSAKARLDEIEQGLQEITSYVDGLEYRQTLRSFGKDPKGYAENLLRPVYAKDARNQLQQLRGR